MKICVAQTRPVTGDIQSNIENHKKLIGLAVAHGAGVVIFPELSLTGYEPSLANELATHQDDERLADFQSLSNSKSVMIGVGLPTRGKDGNLISLVLFQPNQPRQTYSKKYLHLDEEDFFCSGRGLPLLNFNNTKISFAVCYEIFVPAHAKTAFNSGTEIYIASVAKSVTGIDKALHRLSEIARTYSMTVLMSNCIGNSDGFQCSGRSSIWNSNGLLLGQLDANHEGLLMIDLKTKEITERVFSS